MNRSQFAMARLLLLFAMGLATMLRVMGEEGMWPPEQLPSIGDELRRAGLQLDPSRLASLTEHPMNAVVSLGGCTASFVSPRGLVITNHHCAYGSIQYNSTPERNLIGQGFLARSLQDELPASPGARVYVTVEFRDVTDRILEGLGEEIVGLERFQRIERREKELVAECEKNPGMRCQVASYFGGLSFSLVRQLEIRDVRLVYAPPSGVGKFGGDIDNWMWPRHTGDYSFYRAYVGPDGRPASYSTENVPYEPRHFLKIAGSGLREGDFVMVAGYPGSTSRYRLSSEVESTFLWSYPKRIEAYQEWLSIIEKATKSLPDAHIKYASLVAGLNNSLKNNQGMLENFARSDMLDRKRNFESDLETWIAADPGRSRSAGKAFSELKDEIEAQEKNRERDFYYGLAGRSALLSTARQIYRLAREKQKPDMERDSGYQERDFERIRQGMQQLDRRFQPEVDRGVFEHFILRYHASVPREARVTDFDRWFALSPGNPAGDGLRLKLDEMYAGTRLGDADERLELLDASVETLDASSDPFIRLAAVLYQSDESARQEDHEVSGRLQQLRSRYMGAVISFLKSMGKSVYPDANRTLRVTYGKVEGYRPRDAVDYRPFTFVGGVLEKDTGEDPFNTPGPALAAMREARFGRWRFSEQGQVPVNFLSTCDSTGGNSGSPTLNSRGELVGLLFDGNYESMIADWDFMPEITRSIHVDIRYVLWLMEEVDEADSLLNEMGVTS